MVCNRPLTPLYFVSGGLVIALNTFYHQKNYLEKSVWMIIIVRIAVFVQNMQWEWSDQWNKEYSLSEIPELYRNRMLK